ncbi:MAG: FMN-binding negative transcriptional regulator [Vicinamibacterales bacterium]
MYLPRHFEESRPDRLPWNYQVVHAHGTFHVHDDEKFLRGVVGRLTREHEARVEPDHPWKMSDAPRDYVEQMIASVVGISVAVRSMTGKMKLGQNRAHVDRLGAADALERLGDTPTANALRAAVVTPLSPHAPWARAAADDVS